MSSGKKNIWDTQQVLRSWQRYFISSDPSFGSLIASVLNSLQKNKYNSLSKLLESVEKNTSINLSRDGMLDLLFRVNKLVNVIPKFNISKYMMETRSPYYDGKMITDEVYTISCDFVMYLNKDRIKGMSDEYIDDVDNMVSNVSLHNNTILIKYLLKLMNENYYFASIDFLKLEIFETLYPGTEYRCMDLFDKFEITHNGSVEQLLSSANIDQISKNVEHNIKVVSVPFTTFHTDSYFPRSHYHIFKEKFHIGKEDFSIKVIFLNGDFYINKMDCTVYEFLVNRIYDDFFSGRIHQILPEVEQVEEENNDIELETFTTSRVHSLVNYENSKIRSKDIKSLIIKILINEKVSSREIEVLRSMDRERLNIKKNFFNVLNQLSSPFLSTLVNTNSIKILKQYIVSNYGDSLKEQIPEELKQLIERKFFKHIKRRNCYFIEYFNDIIAELKEISDEREYLVESILRNSFYFQNFCFKKYIERPAFGKDKSYREIFTKNTKIPHHVRNRGAEDDLVIVPFLKVKEFLIFLTTANISVFWERLAELFNDIRPVISSSMYKAAYNNLNASMNALPNRSYDIFVSDKEISKEFNIFKLEEIEYIFQDRTLDRFNNVLEELFNLHQKIGFGFDSIKEYRTLLDVYDKRYSEYYLYKQKADQFEEDEAKSNALISFIKKLFNFIPKTMNDQKLYKVMKENRSLRSRTSFYYMNKATTYHDDEKAFQRNLLKDKILEKIDIEPEETGLRGSGTSGSNAGGKGGSASQGKKSGSSSGSSESRMKKAPPPPPPPPLDFGEKKVFDFLKPYLAERKDVFFTRDTSLFTEKVVIYIKDHKPGENTFNILQINTIDQISTYYTVINSLLEKSYIIQKESGNFNGKTAYMLFFSKTYMYYFKDRLR